MTHQDWSGTNKAIIAEVQLPLENVEFAISQHLNNHNGQVDHDTYALLVGMRACLLRVIGATRRISSESNGTAGQAPDTVADQPGGQLPLSLVR